VGYTRQMDQAIKEMAIRVYGLGRALFGAKVKDVYAWESDHGVRFAWFVTARDLQRLVPYGENMPLHGSRVAQALRMLSFPYHAFEYERSMGAADFLMRLNDAVACAADYEEPLESVSVTFIPEPGYPWPHWYYSVKEKKVIRPRKPSWILKDKIVDPGRRIDSHGVDFCKLIGLAGNDYRMGAVRAEWSDGTYFIVTHSMGGLDQVTRKGSWAENARFVKQCGGLLFPSLAVGPTSAGGFGPFVLVADVGVILSSLKPYKQRMTAPAANVYNTDVWTMSTGDFYKDAAVSAFEQLTGESDFMYYIDQNVWPMGPPVVPGSFSPEEAGLVESVSQLRRDVELRMDLYPRDITPEELQEVRGPDRRQQGTWYSYVEAKVRSVMPVSSFPFAAAPRGHEKGFKSFLKKTGFEGELLPMDVPPEVLDVMYDDWGRDLDFDRRRAIKEWASQQYGWHVADALAEAGRTIEV